MVMVGSDLGLICSGGGCEFQCDGGFAMGFLDLGFIAMGRGVHGSVRVRFVPNPQPTQPSRVTNIQTRRRPVRESGRIGRFFIGSGRVSVGVRFGQNSPNLAENWADLVEIRRIWPKTGLVWLDLVGSRRDFA